VIRKCRLAAGVLVDELAFAAGGLVREFGLDEIPAHEPAIVEVVGRFWALALHGGVGIRVVDPGGQDLRGLDVVQQHEVGHAHFRAVFFLRKVLQDMDTGSTGVAAGVAELVDGLGRRIFDFGDHGVVVGDDRFGIGVGEADAGQGFDDAFLGSHDFRQVPLTTPLLDDPGRPGIGPHLGLAAEHVGLGPRRLEKGLEHLVVGGRFFFLGEEEGQGIDAVGRIDELEGGAGDTATFRVVTGIKGQGLAAPSGDQDVAFSEGSMRHDISFLDGQEHMLVAGMLGVDMVLVQGIERLGIGAGNDVAGAVGSHAATTLPHAGLAVGIAMAGQGRLDGVLAVGRRRNKIFSALFEGLEMLLQEIQGRTGADGRHVVPGSTSSVGIDIGFFTSSRGSKVSTVHVRKLLT